MKEKFSAKFNNFLDIIFPKNIKCIYCGDEIKHENKFHACDNCLKNLPFNNGKVCKFCGTKLEDLAEVCFNCFEEIPPFKIARAPFLYEKPISNLIQKFKFENAKFLFQPLAEFMIQTYQDFDYNCNLIIPVPLSSESQKRRKYNQAEELAKGVSEKLDIPILNDVIFKIKETKNQSALSFYERKENVKNAFHLKNKSKIKGKDLLVIDDVMTTGETIKSVCQELMKGSPKSISVLTLAHTDVNRKKSLKKTTKFKRKIGQKIRLILKYYSNQKKIKLAIKKYDKFVNEGKNKK